MNIFALIQGFNSYLEGLNKTQNNNSSMPFGGGSIFDYSSEFKDYLSSEYGTDSSIFSFNSLNLFFISLFLDEYFSSKLSISFS